MIRAHGFDEQARPHERIRLMHLVHGLESGGLENGVVNLCNRLDPLRFRASICVLRAGGPLESRVSRDRVRLLAVHRHCGNDPTVPLRLARLLRREAIRILHSHSWVTLVEGLVAARLAGVPVVVHGEHGAPETRPRRVRMQRLVWPRLDQIATVSEPLADHLSRLIAFPRDRILVVPNGVDTDYFRPERGDRQLLRRRLGLPEKRVMAGTTARLVPVKNHAGALRAVADLQQAGIDIHLALAGDGPQRPELQKLAAQLQIEHRVSFLGQLRDVRPFLHCIDMFVLNSDTEGMSNSILEAMACGLPVVATSVGSTPLLVANQETGCLIPAADTAALSGALARLAARPEERNRLGGSGRDRVCARFSIHSMVQAYAGLYDRLVRGTPLCAASPQL